MRAARSYAVRRAVINEHQVLTARAQLRLLYSNFECTNNVLNNNARRAASDMCRARAPHRALEFECAQVAGRAVDS